MIGKYKERFCWLRETRKSEQRNMEYMNVISMYENEKISLFPKGSNISMHDNDSLFSINVNFII